MARDLMSTKEVAEYLGINDKQVYALIKQKRIPASKATGKWVFPRRLIDEWIEGDAQAGLKEARRRSRKMEGALLAAGSNDPVLDMLYGGLRRQYPEFYVFSANIGSTAGLLALEKGFTDIAWSHLLDPETGEYNIPYLEKLTPSINAVVVNLFYRELGFVVAKGNPLGVAGFEDLMRDDVRFINRQEGSGTRLLLDYHLEKAGLQRERIAGYENEVLTHAEIGLSILSGEADMGIAAAAVSALFGLGFIPIARERFDMICDQSVFFQRGVQSLIGVLSGDLFRSRFSDLKGYDFKSAGRILFAKS
jgi:excisionase family DNA binding protein